MTLDEARAIETWEPTYTLTTELGQLREALRVAGYGPATAELWHTAGGRYMVRAGDALRNGTAKELMQWLEERRS